MLWFVTVEPDMLVKLNPSNGSMTLFSIPAGATKPQSIAAGSDGKLYFTVGNKVVKFDPTACTSVCSYTLSSTSGSPMIITPGPGGMWFTEGNWVGKIEI
jgi:streptogramin lyase